jgi:DNA repair exonuclease SbcCD nuclease subunit
MALRFLHLADLHVETGFGGREATRERLRAATREAFEKAVDLAIEERLHAVLAAGDLYDDALLSLGTELWLVRQIRRLGEAGVWFLAACGNHDPGGAGFRAAALGVEAAPRCEPWQQRVRLFRRATPEPVTVTDRDGDAVGIVVGAGHEGARESANLAARFEPIDSPLPVVGLLHTQVAGAREAEAHERYAPSRIADYERLGYAYFALGHVHRRQQIDPALPVHYAGNLQGRHARETGEKGGLLVEAHAGAAAAPRFVRLGPVRWERFAIDTLPAAVSLSTLVDALARRIERERSPGEELVATIELAGETPLARRLRSAEDRGVLEEEIADRADVLEVELRPEGVRLPVDREALLAAPSVLAEALALIERAAADPGLLRELAPDALADEPEGEHARTAYLRELLVGLPEEIVTRALPELGE